MQSGWMEIFFLAMLAGFIGLRLYHVLGRKTGHEHPAENVRGQPAARPQLEREHLRPVPAEIPVPAEMLADVPMHLRGPVEEIIRADRGFEPTRFVEGAQSAYGMVLESFWKGDADGLADLVSDEVLANFRAAIAMRQQSGERIDNRLQRIQNASLFDAQLNGTMAEITVRFDADIITVTRDAEGRIIAGDPTASVQTHDLWTFSRHVGSPDPAWLLVATEEATQA